MAIKDFRIAHDIQTSTINTESAIKGSEGLLRQSTLAAINIEMINEKS